MHVVSQANSAHIFAHTTPGNLTLVWLRCRQIVKQEADVSAALAAQLPKADLKNTLGRVVNPGGDFQVIPAVARRQRHRPAAQPARQPGRGDLRLQLAAGALACNIVK